MEYERLAGSGCGTDGDAPSMITSAEEAVAYIVKTGFLPLFQNEISGFSLEERTSPACWWTGNPDTDPWEWRGTIARGRLVAYGKFFGGKAGFISREWFPYFANFRRDGYDFDALWDDEKASMRQKKIMDLFEDAGELYSFEVREKAGFGEGGEKNFEGTVTGLMMQTYLCVQDFRQKKNRAGQGYGMAAAVYGKPERMWGYDYVTSAYREPPQESGMRIARCLMEHYEGITVDQIKKVIGAAGTKEPAKGSKAPKNQTDYPANLLRDLGAAVTQPSEDQLLGLEFALAQLKETRQEVVRLRYGKGLTFRQISEQTGLSGSRCSQLCRQAVEITKDPRRMAWITEGYAGRCAQIEKRVEQAKKQFAAEGKRGAAELLGCSPGSLRAVTGTMEGHLADAGIFTLGGLREAMKEDFWTGAVPGIGDESGRKITMAMLAAGLIDEEFEAYKELDRGYCFAKCRMETKNENR